MPKKSERIVLDAALTSLEDAMFKIGEVDVCDLQRFGNMIGALGQDGPKVIVRALNRTGDMAKTRVVRALAKQTGLPQKTVRKAVKASKTSWGSHTGKAQNLEYRLSSSGGDVSLKYFKKRETIDGVEAFLGTSQGKTLFIGDTFFKGGVFPRRRVVLKKMNGHVFGRMGGRTDLEVIKSGVFIPIEMVEGATAAAFEDVVAEVLPRRLDHEINRILAL